MAIISGDGWQAEYRTEGNGRVRKPIVVWREGSEGDVAGMVEVVRRDGSPYLERVDRYRGGVFLGYIQLREGLIAAEPGCVVVVKNGDGETTVEKVVAWTPEGIPLIVCGDGWLEAREEDIQSLECA